MSLFSTPSQMFRAALGRVSEDENRGGDRKEEVRDEAPASVGGELDPVIEESIEGNAGKYEEPAPNDSSLERILNPKRYQDDNQDDVNTPSYHGSIGSVGDLNSIGSFGHFGSNINKQGENTKRSEPIRCVGTKVKYSPTITETKGCWSEV